MKISIVVAKLTLTHRGLLNVQQFCEHSQVVLHLALLRQLVTASVPYPAVFAIQPNKLANHFLHGFHAAVLFVRLEYF
jgi:hypothetical protein